MRFRAERWSTAVLKPGTWADWFLVAQGTTNPLDDFLCPVKEVAGHLCVQQQ